MYFCIRDDDTSFFTSPEELEHAYGEVTQWGPVSLAVIPFCRAGLSKGVTGEFRWAMVDSPTAREPSARRLPPRRCFREAIRNHVAWISS